MPPYKIRLHVLSPLHIGCDYVYEPTGFVIDEQERSLLAFDPLDFVKALSRTERTEFMSVCQGANLLAVFKFAKKAFKREMGGWSVPVATSIVSQYREMLAKTAISPGQLNQFSIARTSFNPLTNVPYIPGSSVKGALRTAYLNAVEKQLAETNKQARSGNPSDDNRTEQAQKSSRQFSESAPALERRLLQGSFETDPFRFVKVSDLLPESSLTRKIVYAVNLKRKKAELAQGPYQIVETIGATSVFSGVINLDEPPRSANINKPITPMSLFSAAYQFYGLDLLTEEMKFFQDREMVHSVTQRFASEISEASSNRTVYLRLGRHSGAEAVTIAGHRNIRIMGKRGVQPSFRPDSTTIWLAADEPRPERLKNLQPFGWVALEVV